MKLTALLLMLLLVVSGVGYLLIPPRAFSNSPTEHQRLKVTNTFKTPEEVVQYYCGRDASGFVWSGLLEIERKAFTLWKALPQHDSFFVAKKYEIMPAKISGSPASSLDAQVEVRYEITGVGDSHGTFMPSRETIRSVIFYLKKDQGKWKIAEPDGPAMAPVVLATKFNFTEPLPIQ